MKTLDEVIERLEDCLHATEADSQLIMLFDRDVVDAIHYLKDYRMLVNDIAEKRQELEAEKDRYQEAVRNCEEAENKYRQLAQNLGKVGNDPLTWDELKAMEGKPVWVEMEGYSPHWGIVMSQDERNGRLCLCGYDKVPIRIEINEDGERVLTTIETERRGKQVRSGTYFKGYFNNDNGNTWHVKDKEVLAWMPLPEPWGGE